MTPRLERAGLVTAVAAGLVLCVLSAVLTATETSSSLPVLEALARAAMVGVPIAVGVYALGKPAFQRFGALLIAAGAGWFVTTLSVSSDPLLYSIGRVSAWLVEVGLLYLLLSFPTGRLPGRVDRLLVGIAAVVVVTLYLPTALLVEHYPSPSLVGLHGRLPAQRVHGLGLRAGVRRRRPGAAARAADGRAVRRRHRVAGAPDPPRAAPAAADALPVLVVAGLRPASWRSRSRPVTSRPTPAWSTCSSGCSRWPCPRWRSRSWWGSRAGACSWSARCSGSPRTCPRIPRRTTCGARSPTRSTTRGSRSSTGSRAAAGTGRTRTGGRSRSPLPVRAAASRSCATAISGWPRSSSTRRCATSRRSSTPRRRTP